MSLASDKPAPGTKAEPGHEDLLSCLNEELCASLTQVLGRTETMLDHSRSFGRKDLVNDLDKFLVVVKNFLGLMGAAPPLPPVKRAKGDTSFLKTWSPSAIAERNSRKQIRSVPSGTILIIDDNKNYTDLLTAFFRQNGHEIQVAESGENGLFMAQSRPFDLVLLDIVLPGISGFEVLAQIKSDIALRNIPVILLSGLEQTEHIVKSIEMGAEDYLPKSVNPILLEARIEACLEKKRLRDVEQEYLQQLQVEQEKSQRLLLNILPEPIADRLKKGEKGIVNRFPEVTVLFADIVGFTALSSKIAPEDLVHFLNEIFSSFDRLAAVHGLEKIKTIGDAYMAVGGLPTPRPDHVEAVAEMALDMQKEIVRFNSKNSTTLTIRVGLQTGPVIAGIIGEKKFIYDLWGDTVNTASRMESHGLPGAVQVTDFVYERLKDRYRFEKRGSIHVKGKGEMTTFLLTGRFVQKYTPQPILAQYLPKDPPAPAAGR